MRYSVNFLTSHYEGTIPYWSSLNGLQGSTDHSSRRPIQTNTRTRLEVPAVVLSPLLPLFPWALIFFYPPPSAFLAFFHISFHTNCFHSFLCKSLSVCFPLLLAFLLFLLVSSSEAMLTSRQSTGASAGGARKAMNPLTFNIVSLQPLRAFVTITSTCLYVWCLPHYLF